MPKTPIQRLLDYRAKHFANDYELADLLDLTAAHLSQILNGRRTPGLATAVKIEDTTGIPARSWAAKRKPRRPAGAETAA